MRIALLLATAILIAAAAAMPVPAEAAAPVGIAASPSPGPGPGIVEIDHRCGPGAHWVHRHHNRYGHLVHGHCRPN
jgi:hypothetical protein